MKWLKFVAWVLGALLVVGGILRLTVMESWVIPDDPVLGASIVPSINAGDTVLMWTTGQPGLGDLIRCTDPEDSQRFVVGRAVGFAGDKVRVENGKLFLNGKGYDTVESCTNGKVTFPHPTSGAPTEVGCSRVEIAGGWHFRGMANGDGKNSSQEHTVGEGRVYLLSDNRTFHDDSRDFGAIPIESCRGKIFFRTWGKAGWSDGEARLTYIR